MTGNVMLAAALGLIARGWPVFPCEPGGKAPLGSAVPRGFKDATLNAEHARRWWTRCPNANVAIPTGPHTVDVLDVDVDLTGTGYPAFNRLKAAGLLPAPIAIISTPRGGLHGYTTGSSQGCGRLAAHHLDFKSLGGYVLVPPSQVGGKPYRLIQDGTGAGMLNWGAVREFLAPPKPIAAAPRPKPTGTGISGLVGWLATRTSRRNESLYWACCRAVENGATESDLEELVRVAVALPGDHHLSEREARRTAASALRTIRRSA